MELQVNGVVHLVCSCGKRLDTLRPNGATDFEPRHQLRIDSRVNRLAIETGKNTLGERVRRGRYRWSCRRCRADVVIRHTTLARAFIAAQDTGSRDVQIGRDL